MSGEGGRRETFEEFIFNSICCKHNNKPQINKKTTKDLGSASPTNHRQETSCSITHPRTGVKGY